MRWLEDEFTQLHMQKQYTKGGVCLNIKYLKNIGKKKKFNYFMMETLHSHEATWEGSAILHPKFNSNSGIKFLLLTSFVNGLTLIWNLWDTLNFLLTSCVLMHFHPFSHHMNCSWRLKAAESRRHNYLFPYVIKDSSTVIDRSQQWSEKIIWKPWIVLRAAGEAWKPPSVGEGIYRCPGKKYKLALKSHKTT